MQGNILDSLRARIPTFQCLEGCSDCCGLAFFSGPERVRILAMGGVKRQQPEIMDCQYLDGDRCSIYAERPLVCRLYGAAENMRCPHGCGPEKLLTEAEFNAITAESRASLGGDVFANIGELIYMSKPPKYAEKKTV